MPQPPDDSMARLKLAEIHADGFPRVLGRFVLQPLMILERKSASVLARSSSVRHERSSESAASSECLETRIGTMGLRIPGVGEGELPPAVIFTALV